MSTEDNARTIRRIYDELWNERNLAIAEELIADDGTNYDTGLVPMPFGPEEMRGTIRMVTAAFPDHRHEVDEVIVDGDNVVLRCTLTGTHEGPFMGIPPHRPKDRGHGDSHLPPGRRQGGRAPGRPRRPRGYAPTRHHRRRDTRVGLGPTYRDGHLPRVNETDENGGKHRCTPTPT